MKIKKYVVAIVLFTLAVATSAMVINNQCEEDDGITTVSGTFDDDYLYLGNELRFSGTTEDLVFLGKQLIFEGTARLGLISLCKNLVFTGEVGNGIIAGGLNLDIDGKVKGNNYFACKNLHLNEKNTIEGNVFAGCAKIYLNGTLNGDLYVGAGEININNQINGNVKVYGGRIIFGNNGKINGNLTYATKEKLKPEDLQKVTGTVEVDEKHKFQDEITNKKNWLAFKAFMAIAMFISFTTVGSILLFLPVFRKLDPPLLSERSFWYTGLWGLIPVLMYPALVVINLLLIVTIPFAFILIMACIPLFFFAHIIGLTLIGKYIVTKFNWNIRKRHVQFLIGLLAGGLLSIIPIVNFLTFLFISALGWGVFISFIFGKKLYVETVGKNEGTSEQVENS
jgi:cytoskeletal protein CcmA (bactofilin family)